MAKVKPCRDKRNARPRPAPPANSTGRRCANDSLAGERWLDGLDMNRTPPQPIRRALRAEVGFGCPIGECANPYLEWHHFDPPWREREHHDPAGMVALCAEHHAKADAGAFTPEQLRGYKSSARRTPVQGRFDWMRNKLLAAVGSGAPEDLECPPSGRLLSNSCATEMLLHPL